MRPFMRQRMRPAMRIDRLPADPVRPSVRHSLLSLLLCLTALTAFPVAAAAALAQDGAALQSAPAPTHKHKHAKPAPAEATSAKPAPATHAIQEPPKPNWPVNSKPNPATISWNASGLRIEAANSSLQQILKEVSTLTGTTVEGLGTDERVYGAYGPGPAREILARLFEGSAYNMLLIGDQGQGTPRQILLTSRNGHSAPPGAHGNTGEDNDDDVEQEEPQQQPQPQQQPPLVRNSFNPQSNGQQGPPNGGPLQFPQGMIQPQPQ